jgi:hypothetical protein
MAPSGRRDRGATGMLGVAGAGALAVICCAGLPVVAGALGGLTLAAALGLGGGLLLAGVGGALALVALRARRRRAREP